MEKRLRKKGLPAVAISQLKTRAKILTNKIWNFALEAKDLKPSAVAGYKIKQLFGQRERAALPRTMPVAAPLETQDEQYFLKLIKEDPHNLEHYASLGRFYSDEGNFTDAKDVYQYLTNHRPNMPDYQAKLAYCLLRLGQFEKAVEFYQRALALDPSHPNRYYNLGYGLDSLGKPAEAAAAFEKAIELEPANPKYYIFLSNVYLKLGQPARAKKVLLSAKKLTPQTQEIADRIKALPK